MNWDFRKHRNTNTLTTFTPLIFRAFIDDKLFVDNNGKSTFDTLADAEYSIKNNSDWWKEVISYAKFCNNFFDNKIDFPTKIWNNMIDAGYVKFKEYICNG